MNDKYIIYFISKTKKKMVQFLEKELKNKEIYDLAPSYGNILTVLYDNDGKLSMSEIGNLIGKDKSTITALIKKLEKSNYVRKTKDENDRRITYIELTDKSIEIQSKFDSISKEVNTRAYKNFSEEEKETLLKLLKKLNNNFNE